MPIADKQPFSYRLVVLTHGDADTLGRSLDSFEQHVTPAPADVRVVVDGQVALAVSSAVGDRWPDARVSIWPAERQQGFCSATKRAWQLGSDGPGPLHVFYLEHDFLITRKVELVELAGRLDSHKYLAQMALMRDAVNEQEKQAGGLFELRRGEYTLIGGDPIVDAIGAVVDLEPCWLMHRSYFTTNPSLMRRSFMQSHPWPEYPEQCEGRFGIDLLDAGFYFGAWGDGEPWCAHAGVRTGFGY